MELVCSLRAVRRAIRHSNKQKIWRIEPVLQFQRDLWSWGARCSTAAYFHECF